MKVAAELRLKHGPLLEACNAAGGVKALADRIGIGAQTVTAWLRMRRCPTPGKYNRWYTADVERSLEEITGLSANELFPSELKAATPYFADNPVRVAVKEFNAAQLLDLAMMSHERALTDDPCDVAIASELSERLAVAIDSLGPREKSVMEMRYSRGMTLGDVCRVLGITRERVRQIEAKAIRKLQQPSRSMIVMEFAEGECKPDFERLDAEFERRQQMSLQDRYRRNERP